MEFDASVRRFTQEVLVHLIESDERLTSLDAFFSGFSGRCYLYYLWYSDAS